VNQITLSFAGGRPAGWSTADEQHNLGRCHELGIGVAKSIGKAERLYRKAAAQGLADAHHALGHLFTAGLGVSKDFVEAARLFRLAAEQGDADAPDSLKELASEREYVAACCMGCGATSKLKTCNKCKVAKFCGETCMRRSWPEHKPDCRRWEAARSAAEP
jgi:hypothetical protein